MAWPKNSQRFSVTERLSRRSLRKASSAANALILAFQPPESGRGKFVLFLATDLWLNLLQWPSEINMVLN